MQKIYIQSISFLKALGDFAATLLPRFSVVNADPDPLPTTPQSCTMADVSSSDFDNLRKDVSQITIFPSEDLRELTAQLLGFLLQPTKSSFQDFLGDLAERCG